MSDKATRLTLRIDLANGVRLGPGKVSLLAGIAEHGSIRAAGGVMGMSYRRAWLLADEINRMFKEPSIFTRHGGKIFYTTSEKPEEITSFAAVDSLDLGEMACYTNPVLLRNENNRIYLFFRGGYDWKPSFVTSDDYGKTWSEPRTIVSKKVKKFSLTNRVKACIILNVITKLKVGITFKFIHAFSYFYKK